MAGAGWNISVNWAIKGYHHFRIRPNDGEILEVEREDGNPYDPFSMKVVRVGSGQQIGRVPANLCKVFRKVLQKGYTNRITCTYLGRVGHSVRPEVGQQFRRNPGGQDRPGGGADLHCNYHFVVGHRQHRKTMLIFEEYLPRDDLERISA